MRELNLRKWDGEENLIGVASNLDSSLKKNTAFIKKVKGGLNKEVESQLLDAIRTTSLEKYLNEIIPALCESFTRVSKAADIQAALTVTSALHLRFGKDFTCSIESFFAQFMVIDKDITEKELVEKLDRIKNVLKLSMEFQLNGVFRTCLDIPRSELPVYLKKLDLQGKSDVPLILPMLKEVMSFQFSKGSTLNTVASFLEKYHQCFLDEENHALDDESKAMLNKLCTSYANTALKTTNTLTANISKAENRSNDISMRTGRIMDEINEDIDKMKERHAIFNSYCQIACPILGLDLPTVETEKEVKQSIITVPQASVESIWATEETRKFYTEFPPLEEVVDPKYLVETGAGDAGDSSKRKLIEELLDRLDMANTVEDVNKCVQFYWENDLSNKASKNKIYQHFKSINDVNKFRNIARFLKMNNKWFDKWINDIIERLDKSFRFQIHHDDFAAKDILIFAELVKFKMLPLYVIFHKIRALIMNIDVNGNIDLLTLLFEGCGKVLQFDPDYASNTEEMIELLNRVKTERNFVHSDYQAVRIFLMSLKPQQVRSVYRTPESTLEEKFINLLIKKRLNDENVDTISAYLSQFDWNDGKIRKAIFDNLTKPDEVPYISLLAVAKVVQTLSITTDNGLFVRVIDQIIEDICIGLEVNDYRENRKRLAQVKFLVEMSNLYLLSDEQLIKILYKIVTFGHPQGIPQKDYSNEFDNPNEYIRAGMVCVIVTGIDMKKFQKKPDLFTFVRLFDYYMFTKEAPIPVETDDQVQYMFDVVGMDRAGSLNDATFNLQKAMHEQGLRAEEAKRAEALDEQKHEEAASDESEEESEDDEEVDAEADQISDERSEAQFQYKLESEMNNIVRDSLQSTHQLDGQTGKGTRLSQVVGAIPKTGEIRSDDNVGFALLRKSGTVAYVGVSKDDDMTKRIEDRVLQRKKELSKLKQIALNSLNDD